jgi:hypothetical protein
MRRAWGALALAAAICASAPAVARAEPIVSLGPLRGTPSAVTDAAGTLHAVSRLANGPRGTIGYCRVPAGATGCSTTAEIGGFPSLLKSARILLRPQDGALIVVASGLDGASDATFAFQSLDGGATWSAPRIVGRNVFEIDEAALTADGTAVDTAGEDFVWQRVPLDGGVESRTVKLSENADGSDSGVSFSPSIGHLSDGRAMIVGDGNVAGVRARVLGAADPFVNASWSAWRATPRTPGLDVNASFGPNGAWAVTSGSVQNSGFRVWRWNGRRFAKPGSLGTIGGRARSNLIGGVRIGNIHTPAFAEDAGGRLHAVWQHYELCGRRRNCLVYRRNEPRGFGPPVVYPLANGLDARDVSIAPNAGGSGWIVWRDSAAISDDADHAVPLATPPRGSRVGSRRIRRARVTVPAHYACIPPGGRFVHRLLVSGRRSRLRIRSVRFSFDGGALARVDRRAPFRVVYHLPFAAGTRHVARARVSYRGGHASVGRMIVMCP